MYRHRTAVLFEYFHTTGGGAGGQAQYVRVLCGDVNLLEVPVSVQDEGCSVPLQHSVYL